MKSKITSGGLRRLGGVLAAALAVAAIGRGWGVTVYVSTNGANISPYTNWANASTNIARALLSRVDGDVIIVSNGVHACYSLSVNPAITIRSLNGPEVTLIDNSRFWGLILNNTGVLDGFTLFNGSNINSSSMLIYKNSTVKNCIFKENWAKNGGALYISTDSLVSNCVFMGNTGIERGGAVYVYAGLSNRIYNCTFYDNRCTNGGGAIYVQGGVQCRNLLIYSNRADNSGGGGIYGTTNTFLDNCTIAYNFSASHGGGVFNEVRAANCIIYTNWAGGSAWWNWSSSAYFTNCCIGWQSSPAIGGVNNFTNAPLFVDPDAANFRLQPDSPCIDRGVDLDWMDAATDREGRPRRDRLARRVDIGAFEYVRPATVFSVR